MKKAVFSRLVMITLLSAMAGAVGMVVDLSGWWKVIDDNGHFIKIQQQGTDLTILDGDGTFLVNAFIANDILLGLVLQPPDTE